MDLFKMILGDIFSAENLTNLENSQHKEPIDPQIKKYEKNPDAIKQYEDYARKIGFEIKNGELTHGKISISYLECDVVGEDDHEREIFGPPKIRIPSEHLKLLYDAIRNLKDLEVAYKNTRHIENFFDNHEVCKSIYDEVYNEVLKEETSFLTKGGYPSYTHITFPYAFHAIGMDGLLGIPWMFLKFDKILQYVQAQLDLYRKKLRKERDLIKNEDLVKNKDLKKVKELKRYEMIEDHFMRMIMDDINNSIRSRKERERRRETKSAEEIPKEKFPREVHELYNKSMWNIFEKKPSNLEYIKTAGLYESFSRCLEKDFGPYADVIIQQKENEMLSCYNNFSKIKLEKFNLNNAIETWDILKKIIPDRIEFFEQL